MGQVVEIRGEGGTSRSTVVRIERRGFGIELIRLQRGRVEQKATGVDFCKGCIIT